MLFAKNVLGNFVFYEAVGACVFGRESAHCYTASFLPSPLQSALVERGVRTVPTIAIVKVAAMAATTRQESASVTPAIEG